MEAPGKPIESNALKSDTMTHLEEELTMLKSEITVMWQMVISQLYKTREALLEFDKDLAREVVSTEKRVNSLELKIDRDCENIFALFNPVAVDLRTVLAILKILSIVLPTYFVLNIPISSWLNLRLARLHKNNVTSRF